MEGRSSGGASRMSLLVAGLGLRDEGAHRFRPRLRASASWTRASGSSNVIKRTPHGGRFMVT